MSMQGPGFPDARRSCVVKTMEDQAKMRRRRIGNISDFGVISRRNM